MLERKKNGRGVEVALTCGLCVSAVCAMILLVGVFASLGVVRGWMQTEQMRYAVLVGLWLGAMVGTAVLCVRTKGIPILCGAVVGGAEVLLCVVVGALLFELPSGVGVMLRAAAGLTGGVLGGILCAMTRTARRH